MEPLIDSRLESKEADNAFRRLDAILRAYGISHSVVRSAHCQRIVHRVVKSNVGPIATLQSKATQALFDELNRGIEMIGKAIDLEPSNMNRNRLLVAINRTNIAEQSPEALLGLKELSVEQASQLAIIHKTQYVPSLKRRSMGAPALRFEGLGGVTSGTSHLFTRSPIFVKLAPALGSAFLFFIVYLFAR